MNALGFASLPWGKPCFPHEPTSSLSSRGSCAAEIVAGPAAGESWE